MSCPKERWLAECSFGGKKKREMRGRAEIERSVALVSGKYTFLLRDFNFLAPNFIFAHPQTAPKEYCWQNILLSALGSGFGWLGMA